MQAIETGGEVTGNVGLAAIIDSPRALVLLPSNGRYSLVSCANYNSLGVTNLAINALIKEHTKRPPICTSKISSSRPDFRREIWL